MKKFLSLLLCLTIFIAIAPVNCLVVNADTQTVIAGDTNGDGTVNNKDLGILMQYLNDWSVEIVAYASDVNGDNSINNKDYGLLMQYLNGWPIELVPPVFDAEHTPLAEEEYYQYNSLNDQEKEIYNKIVDSIKETQNVINVEKYNITAEEGHLILKKALADHPEFFYVSKYVSTTYKNGADTISSILLYYTDGITVDQFGDNYQLAVAADRTNISNQINEFNEKTQQILKLIPLNTTQLAKEKFIHDYLVKNITYDVKASQPTNTAFGQVISHDWDVYGALIEGSSVCEGYSKAFAYLCHCVGINATTVSGYSEGMGHMWNAVQIDNEWYFIDATWDDGDFSPDEPQLKIYSYFNGTTSEFNKTHTIDTELKYPICTATQSAFQNTYAINISDGSLSSNYKIAIDEAIKDHEGFLQVYVGEDDVDQDVLIKLILQDSSDVMQYIKGKTNATINKKSYMKYGHYICLYIEYK